MGDEKSCCADGRCTEGECPNRCPPAPRVPFSINQARHELMSGIITDLTAAVARAEAGVDALPIDDLVGRNDHAVRGLAAQEMLLQLLKARARLEQLSKRVIVPARGTM